MIATPVNEHYLQYEQKATSGTLNFADFLQEPFIMRETGSGTKKEIDPVSYTHLPSFMNRTLDARLAAWAL